MHPVLFKIPLIDLPIHTYGMMIALGFLIGMQLGAREARRIDVSPQRDFDRFISDLTFWILIAAMVGARIVFIIVEWDDSYARDPFKMFRVWEGGLVFFGGLIGSLLFSVYFSHRKGRNFFLVADVLMPAVALGQCFGRLGCLAAGCCWGKQVDPNFFSAIQFPAGSLIYGSMQRSGLLAADAVHTLHVHPVQLYESLGALMIFFILTFMRSKKRFHGQILLGYLFLYPLLRSALEFLRGDIARGENVLGTPLSTSQFISSILFTVAIALFIYLTQKKKAASQPA